MPCLSGFELYSRWVPLIAPAAASFLHFGEQIDTFEKYVGPFCNDGGQDLVHSR